MSALLTQPWGIVDEGAMEIRELQHVFRGNVRPLDPQLYESLLHIQRLLMPSPWEDFGEFSDCRYCFERQWHGPDFDASKHATDCRYLSARGFAAGFKAAILSTVIHAELGDE